MRWRSLFLDKLEEGHGQDLPEIFDVVDDQEVFEGEISHVVLDLHLLLYVLNCFYVED